MAELGPQREGALEVVADEGVARAVASSPSGQLHVQVSLRRPSGSGHRRPPGGARARTGPAGGGRLDQLALLEPVELVADRPCPPAPRPHRPGSRARPPRRRSRPRARARSAPRRARSAAPGSSGAEASGASWSPNNAARCSAKSGLPSAAAITRSARSARKRRAGVGQEVARLHIVEPLERDRDRVCAPRPSPAGARRTPAWRCRRPAATRAGCGRAAARRCRAARSSAQCTSSSTITTVRGDGHRPDQARDGPGDVRRRRGRPPGPGRRRRPRRRGRRASARATASDSSRPARDGRTGDLEQGLERRRSGHRPAVTDEHGEVVAQPRHLRDEPRLADPGLAQHRDQVRPLRLVGPVRAPSAARRARLAPDHRQIEPAAVARRPQDRRRRAARRRAGSRLPFAAIGRGALAAAACPTSAQVASPDQHLARAPPPAPDGRPRSPRRRPPATPRASRRARARRRC